MAALGQISPCSRAQLVERSGLSRATVGLVVSDLVAEGLVLETRERPESGGRGRAPAVLRWSEDAGLVAGIDVGHSHVTVAIATVDAAVIAEETSSFPVDTSPHDTIMRCVSLVSVALERCGRGLGDLVGAAVGVPAPIAPDARTVTEGIVMERWNGIDIVETFEACLGVGVTIENDANLGALAEQRFAASGAGDDLVYVKVGSGIGAGVISNGRLVHGFSGTAGELGHLSVRPDGRVCRCGNRGCLETVVAIPSIVDDLTAAHPGLHDLAGLVHLLDRGDVGARRAVNDAGFALGKALASTVCLLSPSQIVVNGFDETTCDSFLEGLRSGVARFFRVGHWQDLTIRDSTFGDRNELLGAVQLAIVTSTPAATSS
ncbi:ROK family transcriptional regulator [Aeromicrobium sp. CFBP 8757]|uniref:ROK family transcriptional regulator n=1 Tax=Aeromicrobium sp. CFBP 8757 TaxID=2775288 RepID=UPI00177B4054|nr:ROK family transcriptional regulator [Aeromicrobium sp. CFBP 8757]